jgi:hypothetical protein
MSCMSCIGCRLVLFYGQTEDNKKFQAIMNQSVSPVFSVGVDMFQVFLLGFGWHLFLAALVVVSQWDEMEIRKRRLGR